MWVVYFAAGCRTTPTRSRNYKYHVQSHQAELFLELRAHDGQSFPRGEPVLGQDMDYLMHYRYADDNYKKAHQYCYTLTAGFNQLFLWDLFFSCTNHCSLENTILLDYTSTITHTRTHTHRMYIILLLSQVASSLIESTI